MYNAEVVHATYLHEWMKPKNYRASGIKDLESILSVLPEPIWYPGRDFVQHTLCDYIIIFRDNSAISAELKGSVGQRKKAKKQIYAGMEYIENVLNMQYRYGLFIVYNPWGYQHYKIKKEELIQ